jgi:hypothetical protein
VAVSSIIYAADNHAFRKLLVILASSGVAFLSALLSSW